MNELVESLSNALEKEIYNWFLRKESMNLHKQPILIDVKHTTIPNLRVEEINVSFHEIQGGVPFQKDVKGQIEFMKKIEGGSSMTSLEFRFAKTSILYDPTNKQFKIELGVEFFS